MKVAPTCTACHVRFERFSGSWTIPVVMGYSSAALVGFGLIFYFQWRGTLAEHDTLILALSALTGLVVYPVCKNVSLFMLWNNGFMTVDPPVLLRDELEGGERALSAPAPRPAPPPQTVTEPDDDGPRAA
jgi:hypothetical protein